MCTGSQGEPMSALTRIAYDDHANVAVERGDTVIISAKPVPGNELRVHDAINRLARLGAEVLHQEIANVHVSGHACSEEMRTLLSLVRPKARDADPRRVPHARRPRAAGADAGIPAAGIVIAENGSVVELTPAGARIVDRIEAGRHVRRRARRRRRQGRGPARPPPALRGRRADRRHDGGAVGRRRDRASRADRAGLRRGRGRYSTSCATRPSGSSEELAADGITEIKLLQEHMHDEIGQLIYDRTRRRPDDPAGRDRGLSRVDPATARHGPTILEAMTRPSDADRSVATSSHARPSSARC